MDVVAAIVLVISVLILVQHALWSVFGKRPSRVDYQRIAQLEVELWGEAYHLPEGTCRLDGFQVTPAMRISQRGGRPTQPPPKPSDIRSRAPKSSDARRRKLGYTYHESNTAGQKATREVELQDRRKLLEKRRAAERQAEREAMARQLAEERQAAEIAEHNAMRDAYIKATSEGR